jgi:restriction system protein
MARRQKTSPAEDVVSLVALMPWWAGVVLAVVFYLSLNRVAAQQVNAPIMTAGHAADFMLHSLGVTLAGFGQYIVPVLCLFGSAVSAWRQRQRTGLVVDVAQSKAADVLDDMSWQEFELLVGEAFRNQGYSVKENGGGGADGGIDLVVTKGGEKFLVQCKQWKATKVGVEVVRELCGLMAAKGATGGFVVTSGRFSDEATRFASGRNVNLVDGPKLRGLITQARASKRQSQDRARGPFPTTGQTKSQSAASTCPDCYKSMVKRAAKRGANAGKKFWGCTGYPTCKGTRPITTG